MASGAEQRHPPAVARLEYQALLEGAGPLTGDLKLGPRRVLQADDQPAAELGSYFADPGEIDDGAPVDADELARVQPFLELAESPIHQVTARSCHREGPLALRHEVGDRRRLYELRTLLAEVDTDAVGIGRPARVAVVARQPFQDRLNARGVGIGAPAFEALERALDPLALDGLEE